jgi:chromosome segregation ATPase
MKLRVLLWLCSLGLVLGLIVLVSLNRKQQAELAQLRAESQELQALRTQVEETRAAAAQVENAELARLRKENEELLRLRNEVRQLRDERQKLGRDVQAAQAQAQNAQAQVQNAQAQAQTAQAQAEALRAQQAAALSAEQQAAFAKRYGLGGVPVSDQDKINACINNLRQIDGAKQQWALENRKTAEAVPSAQDIALYLKGGVVPACPAGGSYTLNSVSLSPVCSIPGHALPK